MSGVMEVVDADDFDAVIKSKQTRNTIGHAIGKAYPDVKWMVSINWPGRVAQIVAPDITDQYGMVVHLNCSLLELESKSVKMAGELLERFRISRETGDMSSLKKYAGRAIGQKEGGQ